MLRMHLVRNGLIQHHEVDSVDVLPESVQVTVRYTVTNADCPAERLVIRSVGMVPRQKERDNGVPTGERQVTIWQVDSAISAAVKKAQSTLFMLSDPSEPDAEEDEANDPQNYREERGQSGNTTEAFQALLARIDALSTPAEVKAMREEMQRTWDKLGHGTGERLDTVQNALRAASQRVKPPKAATS
jgi:hypothetical protein